ncbi:MAG: A24 family peptidase [Candidatus Nanopelagicales bacterium]
MGFAGWGLVGLVTLLGLGVGSFLTALIHRVPRGEAMAELPFRCPACSEPISARDTVPIVSWLLLRGRCRACGGRIGVRYPLVEAITGVLFGVLACRVGFTWELPAMLYLTSVCIALVFIDLETQRLPNALTLPSYPILAGLLLLPAVIEGSWDDLLRAMLGGLALFLLYFVLALVNPAGMGMGDVKLSGVLGMGLGWFGWGVLVVGALLAFMLGALVGVALLVSGRAGRRTKIPFGPFMVAGALLSILIGQQVADWYVGQLVS